MWIRDDKYDMRALFSGKSWDYDESLDSYPHIYLKPFVSFIVFLFTKKAMSLGNVVAAWQRLNVYKDRQEQANNFHNEIKESNKVLIVYRSGNEPIWGRPKQLILFEEQVV